MDLSKPGTQANLEAAFGGESMANRKYLFFADVAKQLGNSELAKLFRDTANQETEHAFAHFRLLHPELVVDDPASLSDAQKQAVLSRCLELAIEGETYEYTTMYPEFAAQARADRDSGAEAEFSEQISESQEHAGIFRTAARNFGLLEPIEHHHAERYGVAQLLGHIRKEEIFAVGHAFAAEGGFEVGLGAGLGEIHGRLRRCEPIIAHLSVVVPTSLNPWWWSAAAALVRSGLRPLP